MKIQWLGHACFKVISDQTTVIIDPFKTGSVPGFKDIDECANLVLCSHQHGDHYGFDQVKVKEKELDFTVSKLETYHDEVKGAKRGLNTIHILQYATKKIVHLGDLGCELTKEEIQVLQDIDVLLIPVGGFYTIDANQAKSIVDLLQPKITIPMHYRLGDTGYDVLSTVDVFTSQFDDVEIEESPILDLDTDHKKVVVLTCELPRLNTSYMKSELQKEAYASLFKKVDI